MKIKSKINTEKLQTVAVIPSLNPDGKLLEVVDGLIGVGFEHIIIVDDGSREGCKHIFEQLGEKSQCHILTHAVNCGKGRGLKTAFNYYLNNFDLTKYAGVVTADADGQHLPEDIKACGDSLCENPKYFVLGTRDFSEPDVPFKSRYGNNITTVLFQLLNGKRIEDTQTGLRALPNSFVKSCVTISGERFEYEINMLIAAVKSKMPIEQKKIATVYFDSNRETHFNPVKDSARIYGVMFAAFFKYLISSLSCFFIDIGLFRLVYLMTCNMLAPQWSIGISTVLSRVCSALINYSINKNVVFKSNAKNTSTLIKYASLCVVQMCASWLLVTAVYTLINFDTTVIKMVVDSLLFIVSYQIQDRWVFKGC